MSHLNTAFLIGTTDARTAFEKEANPLSKALKQLQTSYSVPAARTEIQRMLAGGGGGAVLGGAAGAASGDDYSLGRILAGAGLGAAGGSLGARGAGRMRESQILAKAKAEGMGLAARRPLKQQVQGQIFPRAGGTIPKPQAPGGAPQATGRTPQAMNIPAEGMRGNMNIPADIVAKMQQAGMAV